MNLQILKAEGQVIDYFKNTTQHLYDYNYY